MAFHPIIQLCKSLLKQDPKEGVTIPPADRPKVDAALKALAGKNELAYAVRDLADFASAVAKQGGMSTAEHLIKLAGSMAGDLQKLAARADDSNKAKDRAKFMGGGRGGGSGGLPPGL